MQHILNIAFDFDDDKVRKIAENTVSNEMDKIIRGLVTDHIAPMSSGYYGRQERDWSTLWQKIEDSIREILAGSRDEIIERAADKLAKSAKSTKVWKEKVGEIADEVSLS